MVVYFPLYVLVFMILLWVINLVSFSSIFSIFTVNGLSLLTSTSFNDVNCFLVLNINSRTKLFNETQKEMRKNIEKLEKGVVSIDKSNDFIED